MYSSARGVGGSAANSARANNERTQRQLGNSKPNSKKRTKVVLL